MSPSTWATGFSLALGGVLAILVMAGLEALWGRWKRRRDRSSDDDGYGTGGVL